MGVLGLWKLLEESGKPVPLESLEGKVLAIDISIWIYQVLQGYQDHHGAPRPNAHLLGLFTRICKLLYYKIKPVFVFDGGVPMLKKNTIASRRKQKSIATSKAQKMKTDLIHNLIKHSVVKTALNKDSKDQNGEALQITMNMKTKRPDEDMFALPSVPGVSSAQNYIDDDEYDSDTPELSPRKQSKWIGNIHNVDVASNEFKALPADVRYDILTDLKETRKQNSWGRLNEMPQESHEFSGFQLKRLLKRRHVQESLESAEKEMGGKTLTLEELEKLLTEQGVDTKGRDAAFRIAADNTTRVIYISDKNALATKSVANESEVDESDMLQGTKEEIEPVAGPSKPTSIVENINEYELNDSDSEVDVPLSDNFTPIAENINEYTFDSDWESENDINDTNDVNDTSDMNDINELLALSKKNKANPALMYMLEYSGLSHNQIMNLIKRNKNENHKPTGKQVKVDVKDIYIEPEETSESINEKKLTEESPENYEKVNIVELQSVKDVCTTKENIESIESVPSSPESDNLVTIESLKDNAEILNVVTTNILNSDEGPTLEKYSPAVKSNDVVQIDTSDSDSDDFIEIQDVPIPDMNVSKGVTKKKDIEITFTSDEKPEDDMFADIFENKFEKKVTPISPEKVEIKRIDTINGQHQTQSISDNDDINLKGKILDTILEESINEETKIELPESTYLNDVKQSTSNDESKLDTQNSDKSDTVTQINSSHETTREKPVILPTNKGDLTELKEQLEDEQEELAKGIGKLERQATNISDQIRIEAQELLRLFGIPYVVAPMEAEAQCAYLEQIKLTDGTITDDSDIWLFGGQCVYKNFFNHNKKVLRYRACDIQHHFKLNRSQLIQLALLVGSDYTTGIAGVGPVTALEILATFPANGDNVLQGLYSFSSWIKKGMIAVPGKTSLRNKLRNMKLDRDFPNQAVVQAYLFPTVDESKDTFTWGKPNVVLLCDYTRNKFGWTKGKFDDTIIPVLRKMEENRSQKLLDMYFEGKASTRSIEPNLSKRVQKALRRLNNDDVESNVEDNIKLQNVNDKANGKPRRKRSKKDDAAPKLHEEKNLITKSESSTCESTSSTVKANIISEKPVKAVVQESAKEYIPQREKRKACALEKKLHAIEVFRKSKQGLGKTKKTRCNVRKVKEQAELSESDSN
ncbi:hypothetical protein PUN28_003078 [Cardiocondyla obscurior]|uniref:Uncharacterized protein n=1 Tax=Cardiocondyla obscurior TaxID=286306 RepID=A0AAW2GH33_9HYME